jgi:beta-N-acetylhexosaminidase
VDIDQAVKGMKDAVASGKITEARLDQSVRKILAAKFQLGLVKNRISPIDNIDSVVSGGETFKLAEEIARKAITLVKDDTKLLPLNNLAGKKVFLLALSNGEDRATVGVSFMRTLRNNGVKFEHVTLDMRATPEEAKVAMEKANNADIVIAGLFGRVRSGAKNSVGLPEPGADVLRKLLEIKKPMVSVSFGNPYFLNAFPTMGTYLTAYGDMSTLQRAAGNAIVGKESITGKLPISLPGLAERGTGIQLLKTN